MPGFSSFQSLRAPEHDRRKAEMVLSQGRNASTTTLPTALRDELGLGEASGTVSVQGRRDRAAFFSARGGRGGGVADRKQARKAQRQQKKQSRGQNQQHAHLVRQTESSYQARHKPTNGSSTVKRELAVSDPKGKAKALDVQPVNRITNGQASGRIRREPKGHAEKVKDSQASGKGTKQRRGVHSDTKTPLEDLLRRQDGQVNEAGSSSKKRPGLEEKVGSRNKRIRAALTNTEKDEEDEIGWLEAHLGGKGSSKADDDVGPDGLDELLDDLDRFYPGMYDQASDGDAESDQSEVYTDDEDEEEEELGSEGDDGDAESADDDADAIEPPKEQAASPAARYVPPALRKQLTGQNDSEDLTKLRRSLKGLLNRMGENNLDSIVVGLESVYRDNSRASTTSALTELILDTVASSENMTDTFVILYATLTASLHRIVGIEFGARFIEQLTERFLRQYQSERQRCLRHVDQAPGDLGKEPRSLAALLAALYSLDVIACPLVYDLIHLLLGGRDAETGREVVVGAHTTMTELDIEILLTVVKLCGAQLRHDDPASLKQIVHLAQESQSSHDGSVRPSLRAKFMLESLSDLRNNRSRATTASVAAESTSKMRKFLAGLTKRHTVRTQEPLRVGLKDLRSADKRGKWWLVGAAWAGYDFGDDRERDGTEHVDDAAAAAAADEAEEQHDNLQTLARQHGMNTLIRQQIFTTLMTGQDYLDAVQRLLALTHKRPKQRREIVRVLLHCLGYEEAFNPYYVVIGSRLANEDQMGTRVTLQYCLWDYLRRLGETNVGGQSVVRGGEEGEGMDDNEEEEDADFGFGGGASTATTLSPANVHNTARAYGWWMAKGAVGLDALRAVDFTALKRGGQRFLRLMLVYMLLSVNVTSPVQMLGDVVASDSAAATSARANVEKIFVLGTRSNRHIAKGLLVFLQTVLRAKECKASARELGLAERTTEHLVQMQRVALDTVRVGVQMAVANSDGRSFTDEDGDDV